MKVIFEDEHLVVVNKPSGLATQQAKKGGPHLYREAQAIFGPLALLHRLDQPASGLVLFARSKSATVSLSQGFAKRRIKRQYLAVVMGEPQGEWSQQIEGKEAHSSYEVMGTAEACSALRLTLSTGRKHQLRIHASRNGSPILGDRRYGGDAAAWCERLALHAYSLAFTHPVTKEELQLFCELPESLQSVWRLAGGTEMMPKEESSCEA